MVSFRDFNSHGPHNWVVRQIRWAQRAAQALERGFSRPLLVSNVTSSGHFIGDADETLHRMMVTLANSRRLYRQGNTVVFLTGGLRPGSGCAPTPIVVDGAITKTAPAIVRNVLMCRELKANPSEYELQFAVPPVVLQQVAAMDGFMEEIPEARYIFNHSVFDTDFNWLDVGYHDSQRILVCGDSFDPAELGPLVARGVPQTVGEVLDRLPPLTRRWVEGFYWAGPVDLINYIGAALMTPLMPILVEDGHPGGVGWANKSSIGKTLSGQCLATLKDGEAAGVVSVEDGAREVENKIISNVNDGRTVIFLDNQKGKLDVPIVEANMTSKQLSIRAFNVQRNVRRPNDLLWLITTNDAVPSDDLLARCIHYRLHYEGNPDVREFAMSEGELLKYVQENRAGILAELAGMIVRWLDAGRPPAPSRYRFAKCGQIIGSVLTYNGLPGFLSNTREEVRRNSTTHQQLVAIAERLIDSRDSSFVLEVEGDIEAADDEFKRRPRPEHPREQKDWVHYLAGAGVITAACSTPEKQKTAASRYLNGVVKVPVEVDIGEHTVEAMIVSRPLGKRRVAYALAVRGLSAAAEAGGGGGAVEAHSAAADGNPCGSIDTTTAPAPSLPSGPAVTPEAGRGGEDGALPAGDDLTDDLWGPIPG